MNYIYARYREKTAFEQLAELARLGDLKAVSDVLRQSGMTYEASKIGLLMELVAPMLKGAVK